MKPSTRGFSLVEVLVAVTITGASLAVLVAAIASAARGSRLAEGYDTALWLAQDRLLQLETALPRTEATAGDFGPTYPGYRWEVTVVELPLQEGEQRIPASTATVSVYFRVGSQERRLQLSTLLSGSDAIETQ